MSLNELARGTNREPCISWMVTTETEITHESTEKYGTPHPAHPHQHLSYVVITGVATSCNIHAGKDFITKLTLVFMTQMHRTETYTSGIAKVGWAIVSFCLLSFLLTLNHFAY